MEHLQSKRGLVLVIAALIWVGCAGSENTNHLDTDESYGVSGDFETTGPASKSDGVGRLGPSVAWDSDGGEVWSIQHQWQDITPDEGIAWSSNSGLNWEEKYRAWVSSMEMEELETGFIKQTFTLTTPHGKALTAPVLECAEVAIFLRAAFAAWYGLPFYLEASDRGSPIYLGHFGFRNADGSLFNRTPNFARAYRDYSDTWTEGMSWPSDMRLKGRGLYGGGDEVEFLPLVNGKTARAGAYFDEIFLNKRVGHFMLLALSWFGSMHLADGANMFHVKADAIKAGDVLLERWQRRGIGHTIPVMRAVWVESDRLELVVATGSMPRRYPKWEEGPAAGRYFKDESAGGPGENSDGDAYAALGGGLRRWRVPTVEAGRYRNTFLNGERSLWINSSDKEAIAQRTDDFSNFVRPPSPEEQQRVALDLVESARAHLSRYPASCSARKNREAAFEELRTVNQMHFGLSPDATDAQYRVLDDYVFETLVYDDSVTCCWNSTTSAMYEIIMDYNYSVTAASTEAACMAPVVFMARDRSDINDGYEIFREHAALLGRLPEWVPWSDDEPCAQMNTTVSDSIDPMNALPFCQLASVGTESPEATTCGDAPRTSARILSIGEFDGLEICSDEDDYFEFTGEGNFRLSVYSGEGTADLDVAIYAGEDNYIAGSSTSDDDFEVDFTIGAAGAVETVLIQVYAVGGLETRAYRLALQALNEETTTGSSSNDDNSGDNEDGTAYGDEYVP